MVVFPPCKINLGLHITARRNDGYHELQTIFYPIAFTDVLEAITSSRPAFSSSGIPIPGSPDENLCVKAYQLLKSDFPGLPAVHLHLHKAIPPGGGLGGGSSDAAHTLLLINHKYQLGLSPEKLTAYASRLGSDCAFFVDGRPCHATGRGEMLETIDLDLKPHMILLVYPGIHISTAWAFGQLDTASIAHPEEDLKTIIRQPVETWKESLVNDFEQPVMQAYPEISFIKNELYRAGAKYAALSGSGSTVFGIFPKDMATPALPFPAHYLVKAV